MEFRHRGDDYGTLKKYQAKVQSPRLGIPAQPPRLLSNFVLRSGGVLGRMGGDDGTLKNIQENVESSRHGMAVPLILTAVVQTQSSAVLSSDTKTASENS